VVPVWQYSNGACHDDASNFLVIAILRFGSYISLIKFSLCRQKGLHHAGCYRLHEGVNGQAMSSNKSLIKFIEKKFRTILGDEKTFMLPQHTTRKMRTQVQQVIYRLRKSI
jgi:hypothetical protein